MGRFQGDLPDRTYRFALAILSLAEQLPNRQTAWVISKQIVRCGTSIGANTHEADAALTDREFIQFCNIARREAKETHYWLRLCRDHGLLDTPQLASCIDESVELVKILNTIVRKSRENLDED